jgi:hypothetical protein
VRFFLILRFVVFCGRKVLFVFCKRFVRLRIKKKTKGKQPQKLATFTLQLQQQLLLVVLAARLHWAFFLHLQRSLAHLHNRQTRLQTHSPELHTRHLQFEEEEGTLLLLLQHLPSALSSLCHHHYHYHFQLLLVLLANDLVLLPTM